jgi:glutamyl-tRNA reductase
MDDLQQTVSAVQSQRKDAIEAANKIIDREVEQFIAWNRARDLGPVIEKLYARYQSLAQEELERTLGKLPNISPQERSHLEELTRRIVNKLLHDPIQMLKHGEAMHGPTAQYLHAMEKLFQLDQRDSRPSPDKTPPPDPLAPPDSPLPAPDPPTSPS